MNTSPSPADVSHAQPLLPGLRKTDPVLLVGAALVLLTLFRLWFITRVELVPDEAYYWLWSKNLAASYRDKGPAIAWVIALGTWLFGENVFGIRFFAVVLAGGIGWQIFLLARRLYDTRIAIWCLGVVAVIPLMTIGSVLMTIDSVSLFSWAWAANLFWRCLHSERLALWAALGGVIGLGFLAKFTNGIQLISIALFLIWSKPHRRLLVSRQTILMCLVFVVTILPVIHWNFQTGWVHAAALHSRSGVESSFRVRPAEFFRFLAGQALVLSPLLAAGLGVAVAGTLRRRFQEERSQFLLSMLLPVSGVFLFFSLNKAGKENWAAPALVTGVILTVVYWRERMLENRRWRWAVYPALGIPLAISLLLHSTHLLRLPSKFDPLRRAQGWTDFARHVQSAREKYGATLLVGNHYSMASMMSFYLPDRPVTYLPKGSYGKSQFSLWPGYELAAHSTALFVSHSTRPVPPALKKDFPDCQLVDDFWSLHRGRPMSRFMIYLCKRDPAAPIPSPGAGPRS